MKTHETNKKLKLQSPLTFLGRGSSLVIVNSGGGHKYTHASLTNVGVVC